MQLSDSISLKSVIIGAIGGFAVSYSIDNMTEKISKKRIRGKIGGAIGAVSSLAISYAVEKLSGSSTDKNDSQASQAPAPAQRSASASKALAPAQRPAAPAQHPTDPAPTASTDSQHDSQAHAPAQRSASKALAPAQRPVAPAQHPTDPAPTASTASEHVSDSQVLHWNEEMALGSIQLIDEIDQQNFFDQNIIRNLNKHISDDDIPTYDQVQKKITEICKEKQFIDEFNTYAADFKLKANSIESFSALTRLSIDDKGNISLMKKNLSRA